MIMVPGDDHHSEVVVEENDDGPESGHGTIYCWGVLNSPYEGKMGEPKSTQPCTSN